jgi:type I restriction enzyme S subunit
MTADAEIPKGYKQTEVGVIPEDWEVSTVGVEFSIQLGKMLDSEKNVGVPKPFLGNRAVQWGRIDLTDIGQIKLTPSDLQRFRLRKGDLLVCEGGEIGRAAIWNEPVEECYYQKALHRLRPKRAFNIELMLNLLQHLSASGCLLNFVTQTSIAHLPKDKFETVPLPFPPTKAEQEAITEALSDAAALIESLEQLLAKKRQIKQGAMQELLTGKKRLPGFSGEWEVGPIASFSGFVTKGSTPTTYGFNWVGDGIRFLRSECVSAEGLDLAQSMFISDIAHAVLHRGEVKAGDILMTITGNVGRVVLLPADFGVANINQHIARIRIADRNVSSVFVFHWLSQATVRVNYTLITTGQAYPQISLKQVRETLVPLPSLSEQTAIATILSDMDAEIAALEARLAKARQIKQGMMQELLTGRTRFRVEARP